jgi:hypothetical protein
MDASKQVQYGVIHFLCKEGASPSDVEGFMEQIETGDETWCHHFDPATKRMSQEWRHPGSQRPEKAQSSATAGKVMLTWITAVEVDANRCNDKRPTLL